MSKRSLLTLVALAAAFLALVLECRSFVLDDSYITYRYAENWALSGELTWNLGEDPVEGFTSFLWVVVNAAAILVGGDPVVASKGIAALCAFAIFAVLWRASARAPLALRAVLVGALAVSPPFALITMQGMETTTTALMVTGVAAAAIRVAQGATVPRLAALGGAMFLAFLSRPDTAVFTAGTGVGAALLFVARRDWRALGKLALCGAGLGVALGIYMGVKYAYFGHLFPNPYYIKMGDDSPLLHPRGVMFAKLFALRVLSPYLVLGVVVALAARSRERLGRVFPVLCGLACFAFYLLTINPIQGFAGRYAFPVVPALLLAIAVLADGATCTGSEDARGGDDANGAADRLRLLRAPWVAVPVVAFFAWWSMHGLSDVRGIMTERAQDDRVAFGKALEGIDGRMFITESGALPFYSKWVAVDRLGLNSERIAHEGLDYRLIAELDPDLIQGNGANGPYTQNAKHALQNRYMAENGFEAVAGVRKSEFKYHYYFVKRDSPHYAELVRRLRSVEGVDYAPLDTMMKWDGVPIAP